MSTISPDVFSYFAKIIHDETGIVYNDGNKDALEKRIKELAQEFGFATVTEFHQSCQRLLKSNIKAAIIEKATNHESSFFRDLPVYENLRQRVLEPLVKSKGGETIRLWSGACSFGQEPYTLSIILSELAKQHPGTNFEIHASDISQEAVDFAKKGCYRQMEVQRGLKDNHLSSYFTEDKSGTKSQWQIGREVQRNVTFFRHNLMNTLPVAKGKFDVVLCRNVLIYFNLETRKKILTNLMAAMKPQAYLLLGAAESIPNILEHFDAPKELVSRIYQLKPQEEAAA